ncbi:MAG: FAD binding domain-containing protein [Candidatus Omnitrophica bacterium]|nr:FAD binding domain-containing protein [Candidatus Omnitrophota bacterium]
MLLKHFNFHSPKTLESALDLYDRLPDVRLQAGGTFLLNSLKMLKRRGAKTPQNVISLAHIDELKGIKIKGGQLVVGAMTNIDEIYGSPLLTGNLNLLKVAARNISSQLIRNMATIGGNLACRYTWTELPAVMVALEAKMHFKGARGEEEIVAAQDFFKNAAKTDKILTHVTIGKDDGVSAVYFRAKKSPYVDIPLLSLGIKTRFVRGKFTETVVAVNNCVAFAQRDRTLEGFLNKSRIDENIPDVALDHLDPAIYDARSSDYKKHMFRVGIRQALRDLTGRHA